VRLLGVLSGMPGVLSGMPEVLSDMHSGWVLKWMLLSLVYVLLLRSVELPFESLATNTYILKSINERDRVEPVSRLPILRKKQ
jgi:hypothetical protein